MRIKNIISKIFHIKSLLFKSSKNTSIDLLDTPLDSFSLSQTYQKIKQLSIKENYLNDFKSFFAFTHQLKQEEIIDNQEKIALLFLARRSPVLNFDNFESILTQYRVSHKMQDLFQRSIHKIKMVSYITSHP